MDPQARNTLIVFLRQPIPGRVKTRLAEAIGIEAAAAVYAHLVDITLWAARDFQGEVRLLFDGDLPPEPARTPGFLYDRQAGDDLGTRMRNALADALDTAERALLIGSDCPGIHAGLLREASQQLADHDVVIGPSVDGGYYLIGFRRPLAGELFSDIAWSTPTVLDETLRRCEVLSLAVHRLETLSDIDTLEDLERIRSSGFPQMEAGSASTS